MFARLYSCDIFIQLMRAAIQSPSRPHDNTITNSCVCAVAVWVFDHLFCYGDELMTQVTRKSFCTKQRASQTTFQSTLSCVFRSLFGKQQAHKQRRRTFWRSLSARERLRVIFGHILGVMLIAESAVAANCMLHNNRMRRDAVCQWLVVWCDDQCVRIGACVDA